MSWWQAFILGLVEGITEYLPVSSTAHLLLTQRLLGIGAGDAANAFAISIQGGAIVAVLGLYRRRALQMAQGLVGRDEHGRTLLVNLAVAFLPAAVIGFLLDDLIERYLLGLWPVCFAWLVGGVAILLVSRWYKQREGVQGLDLEALRWRAALIIGLSQILAMWPGTSRSLMTILSGLLLGLSVPAALEFSFLLGVVTLGAATGYKLLDQGETMLAAYGLPTLLVGFVTAWVSAVLAIRWMLDHLRKRGLWLFGYWRIGLALAVAAAMLTGHLSS